MGASGGNNPPPPPSATPAIQAVNTPTAYETIANEKLKKFHDWESQAGPRDIMDAPGIGDIADIYGSAESLANEKRLGNPGRALSGGGSGDYAKQLDSLDTQDRYDERAAGLSHGLESLKSEAYGLGGSAAELESGRKRDYASLSANQENQYYNRPKPKPLWQTLAGIAIGGLNAASSAATAF